MRRLRLGEGVMSTPDEIGWDVRERWRLRNGSFALVTRRADGGICAGCIEGTKSVHCWTFGKTEAGRGYDLDELVEDEGRDA